jgi:hypothetical protein
VRPTLTPAQLRARRFEAVVAFFSLYDTSPRPDDVPQALAAVRDLALMRDPVQRWAIAGAIQGICMRHPERVSKWREEHPTLIREVEELCPDIDNLVVSRVGEIDYLFMTFLTGGDPAAIDRVIELAKRTDAVGQAALAVILANNNHPGVVEALNAAAPEGARIQPISAAEGDAYHKAAVALAEHLNGQLPPGQAIYVGYAPVVVEEASGRSWDHRLVVCTPTGERFPGIPERWLDLPVDVHRASPDEMLQSDRIQAQLRDQV